MNEIYSIQHRVGIVNFTPISKPQINWLCTAWAVRREWLFIVQVYGYINWFRVGIVSLVSPCSTVRGREVQPLVALYLTVKVWPLETGPEKYPLRGVDPRSHLICTPPRRATPLVPLSSWGYGPQPWRVIRTPVQGGYPRYHSILSPPRRASLLVALPLELSASLPPEFCPFFCVFSVYIGHCA